MTDYSPLSRSLRFLADFRALRVSVDYAAGLSPCDAIIPERMLKNAASKAIIALPERVERRGVFCRNIALFFAEGPLLTIFREVDHVRVAPSFHSLYHENRTGPDRYQTRRLKASTEGASHAPPCHVPTICCGRLLAHEWKEEWRSSIPQTGAASLIAR